MWSSISSRVKTYFCHAKKVHVCQCILEMILAWIKCTYISSMDEGFEGHFFLYKGHSTTTWIRYYTILTTYPPRVENCGHFTYYLFFVHVTKCGIYTARAHLPTYLPLHVHVVIECLLTYHLRINLFYHGFGGHIFFLIWNNLRILLISSKELQP